jgi:hypothetical protein
MRNEGYRGWSVWAEEEPGSSEAGAMHGIRLAGVSLMLTVDKPKFRNDHSLFGFHPIEDDSSAAVP